MFGTSPEVIHPHIKAWRWQNHGLRLLFFSWNCDFNQVLGNNEELQIPNIIFFFPETPKCFAKKKIKTKKNFSMWPAAHLKMSKQMVSPKQDQGVHKSIQSNICREKWRNLCAGNIQPIWQSQNAYARKKQKYC